MGQGRESMMVLFEVSEGTRVDFESDKLVERYKAGEGLNGF